METKNKTTKVLILLGSVLLIAAIIIGVIFAVRKPTEKYSQQILSEVLLYNDSGAQIGVSLTERITIKHRTGNWCEINVPAVKLVYQTYNKQETDSQPEITSHYAKVEDIIIKFDKDARIEYPNFSTEDTDCKFVYAESEDTFIMIVTYLYDDGALTET